MDDFADDTGRVQVYHSDDPDSPHPIQSLATGFQNHYCSQQLPDGGLDSHRFEDLFSSVETVWPEALDARRLSPAVSFNIQGMKTFMHVRGPAARDRTAIMLEAKLRSECQVLKDIGELPPEFERYAGQPDTVPIGVNPHRTLHAMNGQSVSSTTCAFDSALKSCTIKPRCHF